MKSVYVDIKEAVRKSFHKCRYCIYCVDGNGLCCTLKDKEMSKNQAIVSNKCKEFEFCEFDAFQEDDYTKDKLQKVVKDAEIKNRSFSLF